jgi:hypothetical protein
MTLKEYFFKEAKVDACRQARPIKIRHDGRYPGKCSFSYLTSFMVLDYNKFSLF